MRTLFNEGDDSDWTLEPLADSVRITVDSISVYIWRTETGVVVDLYRTGEEAYPASSAGIDFNNNLRG